VMHLSPSFESKLTEVLSRCTSMMVVTALHGARVERNRIYVLPRRWDILLEGSQLRLVEPHEQERPRRTIDHFFRSLAREKGKLAYGVVLSGTGADGCAGLAAIREAGGHTFVQEPSSAAFSEMPEHARAYAEHCAPPAELGSLLMRELGAADEVARA
jgi:two-component system, chemotaxis family, CheB/CheR fusion protein